MYTVSKHASINRGTPMMSSCMQRCFQSPILSLVGENHEKTDIGRNKSCAVNHTTSAIM